MPKLRIISGQFGGRLIAAPAGRTTHPMGDRVRSSLFAMLESRGVLPGARVLDAFAGSGALGFESLSRGAAEVTFIEKNPTAQKIIVANITTLSVEKSAKLIKTGVESWQKTAKDANYDIIFADPPYHDPQFSTVFGLLNYLHANGLMILSYPEREIVPYPRGVVVVDNRIYGEAALALVRLEE